MTIPANLIDNSPDYYDLPQKINNKGELYEKYLFEKLRGERLTPTGFFPAGPDNNAPDIKFLWKGNSYNLEVKLNKFADFGQSGLIYENNKWKLHGKKGFAHESMRTMLENEPLKIQDFVNSKAGWGGLGKPRLFKMKDEGKTPAPSDKDEDYATFTDRYVDIPQNTVSQFYKGKNVHYIHIGGLGTYYMGGDPANMVTSTKMPLFKPELKLRIRKKGSSSDSNYRFSLALLLKKAPRQSDFDIETEDSIKVISDNQSEHQDLDELLATL
tara:strand:+ start:73 stop:882 length:810 start_codon:yes stop_codon:yes gene_type:complete